MLTAFIILVQDRLAAVSRNGDSSKRILGLYGLEPQLLKSATDFPFLKTF
ncbi:MAG: hypothetical protein Ct9H300mP21_07030 [Pseudomonadota bacterium]|nr:MAG: hypothetical protein Ct9H300mP21_07030 [Pseudomonadota bacterium]